MNANILIAVAILMIGSGIAPPLEADDSMTSPSVAPPTEAAPGGLDAPMGIADARHFLARTGFGGTLPEIEQTALLSRRAAVSALLRGLPTESLLPPPAFLSTPREERALPRGATREQRTAFQKLRRQHGQELAAWWAAEMALTDSPFTERLTLFWHDHFVSALQKVRDPELMWRQNALLRSHAAGNFATLLREITTDAAMVIYLDTQANRRGAPNENYARELYELFTLGEGHYSEADIKETARALTGWRVERRSGTVNQVLRQHDRGEKTIFGETGRHDVDDVVRLVLARPRVAEFIVEQLWREFIAPDPERSEVTRLAAIFRTAEYELAPLYEALFLSPAFWVETHRGALFRSPVDLVIGTARVLGFEEVPPQSMSRAMAGMGQILFNPPNVKGWPGGERWITSDSLLTRHQFLERAMLGLTVRGNDRRGGMEPEMDGMKPGDRRPGARVRGRSPAAMTKLRDAWVALGDSNIARGNALAQRLCPLPPVIERAPGESPSETLSRLILDPTYQLK